MCIRDSPKEVVREGDTVALKILKIEPDRHRLGLSLKQADETWVDPESLESEETEPEPLLLEQ